MHNWNVQKQQSSLKQQASGRSASNNKDNVDNVDAVDDDVDVGDAVTLKLNKNKKICIP